MVDESFSSASRRERAAALLVERGAEAIQHPGGSLYEHLERTAASLRSWGAREDLQLAGLCHAVYGTDGFAQSLLHHSRRRELAAVIGDAAEHIVYRYASCDRTAMSRDLPAGRAQLHDRFENTVCEVDDSALADFVELTFANELDVMQHSASLRQQFGRDVAHLFRALERRASRGARAAFESELGDLLSRDSPNSA